MNEQIRAEFEEAFAKTHKIKGNILSSLLKKDVEGDYYSSLAQSEFRLWQAAHARYAGSGKAVGEVVTHRVGVHHPYQTVYLNHPLPEGTKLYTRPAPAVPEGYALVPIEPTDEQLYAAEDHIAKYCTSSQQSRHHAIASLIYKAMLTQATKESDK